MTAYLQHCNTSAGQENISTRSAQRSVQRSEEDEVDLQELYENNNFHKALDPEDFSLDRGWWYRCRACDSNTRVRTRIPHCRHCGFSQKTNP